MPNMYTAFMGQLSPEVITFKQLAPIMSMNLAQLGPVYRRMILLYGTPVLYAPRKWMRFRNIKASTRVAPSVLLGPAPREDPDGGGARAQRESAARAPFPCLREKQRSS